MTIAENPDYFEQAFPPDRFPQFQWNPQRPEGLPFDCWTTETTHRDGQQGGIPLSAEQGIEIFDLLCEFTGKSGAIRQAEFFIYSEADRSMLKATLERYKSGAPIEPTTWIRASSADAKLIVELGIKETGMLASISDYHTFHKFKPGGRSQAAQVYLDAVRTILDAGIKPRLHLEDATRASTDYICWFIEQVQELCSRYDPSQSPKFRICDTMGVGLPYDFVELPRSVPRLVRRTLKAGVRSEQLEFHPHNDTHLVVANCLAALLAGCSVINGTCLGKGERSGNAPLEGVILHLLGMGFMQKNPPDFVALNKLAEKYEQMGHGLAAKYPLFGRDAHRTRAGIHADGLNKFWAMYAPFNVPKLLGRPLEVSLTKDSGIAGIQFLIKQHLGIFLEKKNPSLLTINDYIQKHFESGRSTSIDWEEIEPIVRDELAVSR